VQVHDLRAGQERPGLLAEPASEDGVEGGDAEARPTGRDETRPFRRLVRELGIADSVTFAGSVPDPAACYAAADVLLFPTTFDSFAIVTVEAMSAGTPVITTIQNGGSEIIEEGRNGWVLPDPAMTERMADHLLELRDPEKRRAMKEAAVATAQRHTAESKFREIEAILVSAAR
jgi:UDP-glucose:(heptosyl)LPS alpha-1,3-glucosyltransferase